MVTYLPRSAWGARPPEGKTELVRSEVEGTAIHYPGSGPIDAAGDAGFLRVASALRSWQNYHMDDRDWSDIAYQIAVDQAGRAWTLRGLNIRSGANGNADVNRRYGAILLVIGTDEPLSAALKATTRGVVADFRRWYPAGTAIEPHSAVRPDGTLCPGNQARAAIARGELDPDTPPPPKDWFDMATKQDLEDVVSAVIDAKFAGLYNLAANGTAAKNHQAVMAAIAEVAEDAAGEVMATQIVDMQGAYDPAAGQPRPTIAFSSHVAHMPTRVVKAEGK
jgi:hypothetical protein